MKLTFLLKIALQSIFKNKMRTLLTMLGIIIGVGAFIIMVAYGQGMQRQVRDQVQSLGVNLLTVFPAAYTSGGVSFGRLQGFHRLSGSQPSASEVQATGARRFTGFLRIFSI
jgi:putative ABC transport system permease protein